MLSPTRRHLLPVAFGGALAVGLTLVPAQAAPAGAATVTSSVSATSVAAGTAAATTVATTTAAAVTPATVPAQRSAAQVAASRAAAARAAKAARVAKVRSKIVRVARAQVGDRYVAGHAGPNKFDCSGLALYVARKAAGRHLPHYSKAQYHAVKHVSRKSLRPGDLVFFFRHGAHHVGIYIGGGKMVNATNPRGGVKIGKVFSGWYGAHYSGAGRLV